MVVAEPEAVLESPSPSAVLIALRELTDLGEKDGPERLVASEAALDVLVEQLVDARSICVVKFRSNVVVQVSHQRNSLAGHRHHEIVSPDREHGMAEIAVSETLKRVNHLSRPEAQPTQRRPSLSRTVDLVQAWQRLVRSASSWSCSERH